MLGAPALSYIREKGTLSCCCPVVNALCTLPTTCPDGPLVSANGLCRPVCEMVPRVQKRLLQAFGYDCPSSLGSLPPAATPLPPAALGCGGNDTGASRCRPPGLGLRPHILHRQHVSQDCSDGVLTRGSTTSNTDSYKKQTGERNNGELDASGESDINSLSREALGSLRA